MTRAARLVGAAVVAGVVTAAGYAADAAGEPGTPEVLGPGLVTMPVDVHHSRFSIDDLRVAEGTLVRFVVDNGDPIHHELVVGDDAVHARHADGHEEHHPPVPGEVSVGPEETGLTMYAFDEPGTVVFACHLPRHYDYGMHGTIEVVPTDG